MSGPPHGNAETARWSQTVVDKFPSFVVDTTENSTLPERSGAQILRQTRREGDRQLNLAVLPPRGLTLAYRPTAMAISHK
jgi:hypothetical protein